MSASAHFIIRVSPRGPFGVPPVTRTSPTVTVPGLPWISITPPSCSTVMIGVGSPVSWCRKADFTTAFGKRGSMAAAAKVVWAMIGPTENSSNARGPP